MDPKYCLGNKRSNSQILSWIFFISVNSSIFEGFLTIISSSLFLTILNSTEGGVTMSERPNSLSSLSITISRWSNPRKPHRNPKPNADEVSGSYMKLAPFKTYLSMNL